MIAATRSLGEENSLDENASSINFGKGAYARFQAGVTRQYMKVYNPANHPSLHCYLLIKIN